MKMKRGTIAIALFAVATALAIGVEVIGPAGSKQSQRAARSRLLITLAMWMFELRHGLWAFESGQERFPLAVTGSG